MFDLRLLKLFEATPAKNPLAVYPSHSRSLSLLSSTNVNDAVPLALRFDLVKVKRKALQR